MKWTINYYSEEIEDEILNLPTTLLARYLRLTETMKENGGDLGMPRTRAMKKGLFELRLKGKEGIGRVFYCTIKGNKIYMLHSFIKKTDKTPPRELDIAIKRMQEVKKNA